jgi:uncharacterized protein YcbK (DUF882 family)
MNKKERATDGSSSPVVQNRVRFPEFNRRHFLKLGTVASAVCFCSALIPASLLAKKPPVRTLHLYNPHTDEHLKAIYFNRGSFETEALKDINHLFRDYRTNQIKPIYIGLIEYLFAISQTLDLNPSRPFHVLSGYRAPETNAKLRRNGGGVAKNSLHIEGRAVDIRVKGYRVSSLYQAAVQLRRGGVGYYPKSKFIHVDVGPIRYW